MTLKIHEMNTERLQKKLQESKEENSMLMESKAQVCVCVSVRVCVCMFHVFMFWSSAGAGGGGMEGATA